MIRVVATTTTVRNVKRTYYILYEGIRIRNNKLAQFEVCDYNRLIQYHYDKIFKFAHNVMHNTTK